jgi:DNA modification methylase
MAEQAQVEGPIQVRYLPLSRLPRAPRNPKSHDLDVINDSITRFGFVNPVVINEKTGRIVAGHGRVDTLQRAKAASKQPPDRIVDKDGDWFIPVLVGVAFASDAEAEAYVIADNQTTILGGWDEKALADVLKDHVDTPFGLAGMGFSNEDVADLLLKVNGDPGAGAASQDNEPIDKSAELQAKWGTAQGQLWRIGPHRLWCGDSQTPPAELFAGGKIRMVWTDPPYGVSYGQKTDWMKEHNAQKHWRPIANDDLKPDLVGALFAGALKAVLEHAQIGAACYATVPSALLGVFIAAFEASGFSYKHCLAWVKQQFVMGRSDYHYRHEPILYGWIENGPHYFVDDRKQDSVFDVDRPAASEFHPTTKPVELVARMVANSSRPGECVYDPFSGSGTTLVACEQLKRAGRANELDPGYAAVALERLALLGLSPELIAKTCDA